MFSSKREEIMEMLFEPTIEIIERLEKVRHTLHPEELLLLDQLKIRVGMYAYKRARKAREDADGFFQKSNQNFSH